MKKLLTLITIVALTFCLCSCGNTATEPEAESHNASSANEVESTFVGEWEYIGSSNTLEDPDYYLTADIAPDSSLTETITLNDDNTGVDSYTDANGDNTVNVTWKKTDSGMSIFLENGREWKYASTSDGSMLIHQVEKIDESEPDIIAIYKKK